MPKAAPVDAEMAEMRRLRDEGLSFRAIALRVGYSEAKVRYWLDPVARRRMIRMQSESKLRHSAGCVDCGKKTPGSGLRCRPCYVAAMRSQGRRALAGEAVVPAERLQPLVVREVASIGFSTTRSLAAVAARIGVSMAVLERLHRGDLGYRMVDFETADRIVTGTGNAYLSHLSAELGGFSDLYDDMEEAA